MAPLDYTTELARVRLLLMESGTAIWSDSDLQGAIRLSLQEINATLSQAYTLNGLDSAVSTTLPGSLEGTLTVGAGMYASGARAVDRAEAYELANESGSLKDWWEVQRTTFTALLDKALKAQKEAAELTRLSGLRSSSTYSASWADDFGEKGVRDV